MQNRAAAYGISLAAAGTVAGLTAELLQCRVPGPWPGWLAVAAGLVTGMLVGARLGERP